MKVCKKIGYREYTMDIYLYWLVATQIILIFTPILGEMIQFEEHIFQMGWNQQLDGVYTNFWLIGDMKLFWFTFQIFSFTKVSKIFTIKMLQLILVGCKWHHASQCFLYLRSKSLLFIIYKHVCSDIFETYINISVFTYTYNKQLAGFANPSTVNRLFHTFTLWTIAYPRRSFSQLGSLAMPGSPVTRAERRIVLIDTVDGWNPAPVEVVYPIWGFIHPSGAGFLKHQQ